MQGNYYVQFGRKLYRHKSSKNYLSENFQLAVFDFDEQDLVGLKQLLQLPFYHGIIKEMIDVKFVET